MHQMLGRGIRTLAETRDGRVTVTITVDAQESRQESADQDLAIGELIAVRDRLRAELSAELDRNAELAAELKDRDRTLVAIRDAVNTGDVSAALERARVVPLAKSVKKILELLSSFPGTGTSQA